MEANQVLTQEVYRICFDIKTGKEKSLASFNKVRSYNYALHYIIIFISLCY